MMFGLCATSIIYLSIPLMKRSVHFVKDLFVHLFITSLDLNVLLYMDVCPCIVSIVCFLCCYSLCEINDDHDDVSSVFLPALSFTEGETASDMNKTMLKCRVFYVLTLVNIILVNICNSKTGQNSSCCQWIKKV